MFRIRERVLIPLLTEKYKRWSRVVARKIHGACRDAESRKVSHPWTVYTSYLLMSKNSIKKSSWKPFLNVWKRENWKLSKNLLSIHVCILRHICFEGKLVLSLTRSNFFTGGNHVNSVPDLAARPPHHPPPPHPLTPLGSSAQDWSRAENARTLKHPVSIPYLQPSR